MMHVAGSSSADTLSVNLEEERTGDCAPSSLLVKSTKPSAPSRSRGPRRPFPRGEPAPSMHGFWPWQRPNLHAGDVLFIWLFPCIRSWLEGVEHVVR